MVGLLDRWKKKQEKEQLNAVEKTVEVKSASTKASGKKKKNQEKPTGTGKEQKKQETKKDRQKDVKDDTKKSADRVLTTGNAYKVLISPLVSEKSAGREIVGQYTFIVSNNTTKLEIKKAIEEIYNVMPRKIRVMNLEGKRKSFGHNRGKRGDWKKAIVTLPKGRTISIHEGV